MKRFYLKKEKGFTLVEMLVTIGIFTLLAVGVAAYQRNIFSFNSYIQADLRAQMDGRRAVVTMMKEMREMSPSSLGAYPIAVAATSSLTFYSNIDGDAYKEQIRYYIQNRNVYKSVLKPSGTPLAYTGTPTVFTLVTGVSNGTSTPLFSYYDSNHAGTSTPLSIPINISQVKLIKATMLVDRRSSTGNVPITITSQTSLRNLKDNL